MSKLHELLLASKARLREKLAFGGKLVHGDTGEAHPARVGRYELRGVLGSGSYGIVYLGYDRDLDRQIAVKIAHRAVSDSDARDESSLQEARKLARLRHPGIVAVYDVGLFEGRRFVVSDLLEGISLKDLLQRQIPEWNETVRLVAAVAEALAHAHDQGIVHRDVKPENIILTAADTPVLVDFGVAISAAETDSGGLVGTPAYMAPEQIKRGDSRIDGRTDIYALGVILYRLLCARYPFRASNTNDLFKQVIEDLPPSPREFFAGHPAALDGICLKCLAKAPEDRFDDAVQVAGALRRTLSAAPFESEASATLYLDIDETPAGAAPPSTAIPGGERRQVTVLTCRIVPAAQVALEQVRECLRNIHARCSEIIRDFDGCPANSEANSLSAYFGYPRAQEDAAVRAVLAALKMRDASGAGSGTCIAFGIGCDTGLVIAESTDPGEGDPALTGDVLQSAPALARAATPGRILIGASTHALVATVANCKPSSKPADIAHGRAAFEIEERLRYREQTDSNVEMVGRRHELGLLLDRWSQVRESAGQVVLVSGDAGVGKSRLVREFHRLLTDEPYQRLAGHCSTYHMSSALHPIVRLIRRMLRFDELTTMERKRERLETLAGEYELPPDELVPLLADFLAIPRADPNATLAMPADHQREQLMEALLSVVLAMSEREPVLFVIEDLHWCDPSTIELLGHLVEHTAAARIMLVLTYRQGFNPPWTARPHVSQLTLVNLARDHAVRLVESHLGAIPDHVVMHIVERTDGVPLFIEELAKQLRDSGALAAQGHALASSTATLPIPATLHDALMARLDRLGECKPTAQLAAVAGREFSVDMLKALSDLPDAQLEDDLDKLVDGELLQRRGLGKRLRYLFKHSMVRDAAYESLLHRARRDAHDKLARALETRFADLASAHPELVAQHHTEAGNVAEALDWWQRAGRYAADRSANVEALDHLNRGIALLGSMDPGEPRNRLEFSLRLGLATTHIAVNGLTHPATMQAAIRARALCHRLGDSGALCRVLVVLSRIFWGRNEQKRSLALSRELLNMARAMDQPAIVLEAHESLAQTLTEMGQVESGQAHFDAAITLYAAGHAASHAADYGVDPGVYCHAYRARNAWLLGFPSTARRIMEECLAISDELDHAHSRVCALDAAAFLHLMSGEHEQALAVTESMLAIALDHQFAVWVQWARILNGAALAKAGSPSRGAAQMRRGIAILREDGMHVRLSLAIALRGEAEILDEDLDTAQQVVDEAIDQVRVHGSAFHAELLRVKADVLAARDEAAQAEACYRMAIDHAGETGLRAYELRARSALANLLTGIGRGSEVHDLLTSCYQSFTEGWETLDLRAAKRLLDAV